MAGRGKFAVENWLARACPREPVAVKPILFVGSKVGQPVTSARYEAVI